MAATNTCDVCDDVYKYDTREWSKQDYIGSTKYYKTNGTFTRDPKLIRMISCSFQGLRKLTVQKPVDRFDSFAKALEEGSELKLICF